MVGFAQVSAGFHGPRLIFGAFNCMWFENTNLLATAPRSAGSTGCMSLWDLVQRRAAKRGLHKTSRSGPDLTIDEVDH